jgi:uncharacterized membrane protein YesL
MAAFRTLWRALLSLYEETLTLIGGNLAALVLNLPLGIVLFVVGLPLAPMLASPVQGPEENNGVQWLVALIAWLMPFLPTPGNVALAGVSQVAAGPDVPNLQLFRRALGAHWRIALRCTLISVVVLVALIWNIGFYLTVSTGWLRFVSIIWLYGALFWLSLHIHLVPLMVHVVEPRVLNLYKRAAFITLGHFGYTFLLMIALLILGFIAVVFLPLYVLAGGAYISMVQAHALREVRRRHGDLVVEPEEEVSRL